VHHKGVLPQAILVCPGLAGERDEAAFAAVRREERASSRARAGRPVSIQSEAKDHAMNGMRSVVIVTKGRIMSRSSCSRMWQWYMYRPL
jgi:hypothetical protein